jgi:NAD(P)-dependent dehydrogenase (short-subunit alcohol dehydrogenase family)
MSFEFEGELAVVTGGAAGIGAAIVRSLASRGANIAIVDIASVPEVTLSSLATRPGQRIAAWSCDVTKTEEVESVCHEIRNSLGDPAILINNVGGSGSAKAVQVEETTDDIWDSVLSLNIGSILRFCRAFVPAMKQRRSGRIVNVSSTLMNGMFGEAGTVGARLPYVTSKAAIVGMTKQLAKDLGPYGIWVNAIAPGFTLPDDEARITKRFRALPPEQQKALVTNVPAGRPGSGEDMANAVCFLASPHNTYVSGQILAVDGGG